MRKNLVAAILAALAPFGVAAPAVADTTIKAMFQGDPWDVTAIGEAAKRFEAANAGVHIELVPTPHDSYNEKVGAAVSAKTLPDLMQLDAPFLANYVWSGFLQPIEPLVDKAIIDDMTPSNVAQGTYPVDKKLYAIALIDSTVMLYIDRKRLESLKLRVPTSPADAWTKAEFEAALQAVSTAPGVKWPLDLFRGYGVKTEWITYGFEPILVSSGCDLIDRSTWKAEGTLDSPACVSAVTMLADWVKKGWVVPQSAGTNQFFAEGRPAGIAWGGFWFYAEAHAAMGDDVVVLPLPKFGDKSASPNGTWIWSVTKTSANPQLAGKFLSFLLKDDGYRAAQRDHSAFPGLKSFTAESPLYAKGGAMHVGIEQADTTAVQRPPHPAYPTITLAFMTAIDSAFNGGDVKQALAKAAKTIDEDIDDNDGYAPFGKAK